MKSLTANLLILIICIGNSMAQSEIEYSAIDNQINLKQGIYLISNSWKCSPCEQKILYWIADYKIKSPKVPIICIAVIDSAKNASEHQKRLIKKMYEKSDSIIFVFGHKLNEFELEPVFHSENTFTQLMSNFILDSSPSAIFISNETLEYFPVDFIFKKKGISTEFLRKSKRFAKNFL